MQIPWMRLWMVLPLVLQLAAGQGDESPEVQFRAAMQKELVQGDLAGAIALYQKIAANPDAPRSTTARALLQLGLCYEKLGDALAAPSYQKVIDGYPEQTREVEAAKRRLAGMAITAAAAAKVPAFQRIEMTARFYGPASLSPQGDDLAFTAGGSLWAVPVHGKVHPEIAGVPRKLTAPMGAWGQVAWSGDGNWIAFNAQESDIYVIPSSGGEPARVAANRFPGGGRSPWDYAISLSPDGTKLAYGAGPEGQEKVHVMPLAGGQPMPLAVEHSRQPSFSPDGRWVACVTETWTPPGGDGDSRSLVRGALWLAPSGGGEPIRVGEFDGRARGPVWSPDGGMIAFLHDDGTSGYTRDLRIMPIGTSGRPAGPSAKLELPFVTEDLLAGWTAPNEIGILRFISGSSSIYKVALKAGRAARISTLSGEHPRWSPDASRIYFRDRGGIASVPAGGGESAAIQFRSADVVEAVPGGSNEPSPDGSRLVLAGYLKKPGGISVNIWTMASDGSDPRQVTDLPSSAHARFPCWSPDGKSIAFVKIDQGEGGNIYVVPADGGEIRRLTSAVDKVEWARLAWSPDGRDIAYFSRDTTLNLFNLRSGRSRIVLEMQKFPGQRPALPGGMRHNEMAWSPDGSRLAYTYNGSIWLVGRDDPRPVEVETGRAELMASYLDWSPDGDWLVFTGHTGFDRQLHLMSGFMPLVTRQER